MFGKHSGALAAQTGPTTSTNAPLFEVKGYLVSGNTVLPPEQFLLLTNYTGHTVTLDQVRKAVEELQLTYRRLGFVTIGVSLPRQKLTNGIVHLQVTEGTLNRITVHDNRHFSDEDILRALPGLETNILINTKWFQPELDAANANPDRQIYPVINPGLYPGTTELDLNVKDRLPLHGHMELNNKATPGTPLLRLDSALQYNNLWQLEHQVGIEYNFSPQSMKPDDQEPQFYDQPAIASYSGFYRLPLSYGQNLRDTYENLPVDFGYDQVTHRFNLPPPTGRPEWIVYASRSTTDTGPRFSPITVITNSATLSVSDQVADRNPSQTSDIGTRFVLPLPDLHGLSSSLNFGADYKSFQSQTYATNLTTVQEFSTNNPTLTPVPISPPIVTPNAENSAESVDYVPLSLGWSGSLPDKHGATSFNFNDSVFLSALASHRPGFQAVAGSTAAGGNYTVLDAGLTRDQTLPSDWSLQFRANGQWSSAPLINNEQFALGGTSGVRGYEEGESYGDSGWRTLFDLHAPPMNIGYMPDGDDDISAILHCSWFMDYGQLYSQDRPALTQSTVRQWGTGLGFYLTLGQHIDARLTLAWALQGTSLTPLGTTRAYFSINAQF